MATSSLSKTFYIDSKKEAKSFVSMLANSSNSQNNTVVKTNQISKERMANIISRKLNGNNK